MRYGGTNYSIVDEPRYVGTASTYVVHHDRPQAEQGWAIHLTEDCPHRHATIESAVACGERLERKIRRDYYRRYPEAAAYAKRLEEAGR